MQKKEEHIEEEIFESKEDTLKEDIKQDKRQEGQQEEKQLEEDQKNSQEIEIEDLKKQKKQKDLEIRDLENKLEDIQERMIRLQADFDNYKKRITKEKENVWSYATEEIIKELLPVLDNFERALSSLGEKEISNNIESYIQGVQMVYNQFIEVLKKEGLEEIPALGKHFDPNLHHAVAQESKEDCEENLVIEVYQKGYKLKDKVIRPSMVKVCIH
ncbi:nucleotide exchange factor GrpE [Garciella nitratireducens]|uniref:nucleotide exchange factor GrpE n=1 Tax=Garciella nitratireducens TaxID=218205 RepID=UPI000DEA4A67|nr:nucleotide exchange factor GrpE [Garciella nitratireducens]RBP45486.1 molecular chaperone GrpE [Garciella nitratireducens]